MEIIIGIIIGSIVSIISALFGRWINRDAAQKAVDLSFVKVTDLIKIQEFNKAATYFRSAFTKEIRLLKCGKAIPNWLEGTAYLIIKSAFIKHENARILFEFFLNKTDLPRFNQVWEEYRSKETKEIFPDDDFFCYHSDAGDSKTEKIKRELALNTINELIKFTKFKQI